MKREISFMLLLGVLGLANIGFNIFTNWNLKKADYPGLRSTLNFDPEGSGQSALSPSIDASELSAGFSLKTEYAYSEDTCAGNTDLIVKDVAKGMANCPSLNVSR
jgi:hypothetical protein